MFPFTIARSIRSHVRSQDGKPIETNQET